MTKGFYSIMLAQFLSSLADNALLIAAIALLTTLNEPAWMTPLLKLFFVVSYVIFAAWVGIFADSMPKGRVMFITNAVKTVGCIIMLFGTHPLPAASIRHRGSWSRCLLAGKIRHSHGAASAGKTCKSQRLD